MPISALKNVLLTVTIACLVLVSGAGADDIRLPDMGSPADAILSTNAEARIGRAIMRDIRKSGQVVEDPLLNEYINEIGNKVARELLFVAREIPRQTEVPFRSDFRSG